MSHHNGHIRSHDADRGAASPGDGAKPTVEQIRTALACPTEATAAARRFAVDVQCVVPRWPATVAQEIAFRDRVVEAAVQDGIRQFVVLRPDFSFARPVHEVAQDHLTGDEVARVLYVTRDRESRELLRDAATVSHIGGLTTTSENADLILSMGHRDGVLDLGQPVCVLAPGDLQHTDAAPEPTLEVYRTRLASRSWLAITQLAPGEPGTSRAVALDAVASQYRRHTTAPLVLRTRAELESLLVRWEPRPPGFTTATRWPEATVWEDPVPTLDPVVLAVVAQRP